MGGAGFLPEAPTPDHFVVGRYMVIFLSGLTLVAVAEFGRRLVSPVAGGLAAAFLVISPLFTKCSFIVSVNPSVALWATASGVIAATLLRRRDRLLYVLGGVFVGLTVGSKYIGVTAAAPIVLAHFLGASDAGPRRLRDLALCLALIPITFLATTPYAVLDLESFMETMAQVRELQDSAIYPGHYADTSTSHAEYAAALLKSGYLLWPMVLAGVGAAWLLLTDWRRTLVLVAHPLLLFALVGGYRTYWLRNLVGVLPFLALLSACGVVGLTALLRRGLGSGTPTRTAAWLLALALLMCSGATSFQRSWKQVRAASLVDTRAAALEWVAENIPPGACIIREQRTPEIEDYYPEYDVRAVRSIIQLDRPDRRDEYAQDCDFVMLSYAFNRTLRSSPEYETLFAMYQEFTEAHTLAAEFIGDGRHLTGATIRIYRMP